MHGDGKEVSYSKIVYMLEVCLHTLYRHLHIGPHGLRIGSVCLARWLGLTSCRSTTSADGHTPPTRLITTCAFPLYPCHQRNCMMKWFATGRNGPTGG